MSEKSGFFLSQGGDRKYTPEWLARYVNALVSTGVYDAELGVTAPGGMKICVSAGRAWIKGYLYELDAPMDLDIAIASSSMGRKDNVVVRLNLTDRIINVLVVTGTPGSSPTAPSPTRTADTYDLKLAEINVPAGTTEITQSNITDCRLDDSVCGITVCTVQHIPTADFLSQMWADFLSWFERVQGILGEDAAGNLLRLARPCILDFSANDWTANESEMTLTVPAAVHGKIGTAANCSFLALVNGVYDANVWCAMETRATVGNAGEIVLHYNGSNGYTGRAFLNLY